MSHSWDCALFPRLAWAVQEQDIVRLLSWCCFTQCQLMGARTGTQAAHVEGTDFHVLHFVHSHGIFLPIKDPFQCFIRSRIFLGGGITAAACGGLEDAPGPQLGKMTQAPTSCFTSLMEVAELWPAGAMLGAWLRLIGDNQFLADFAGL